MRIHGLLPPAVKPLHPPPYSPYSLILFPSLSSYSLSPQHSISLYIPFPLSLSLAHILPLTYLFPFPWPISFLSLIYFPFLGPYPSSHLFISLSLAAILPLTYLFLSQTLLSLPFSSLYLLLTIVSPSIPYVPLIDFTPVLPLTFSLYTSFPLLPNFHILTF